MKNNNINKIKKGSLHIDVNLNNEIEKEMLLKIKEKINNIKKESGKKKIYIIYDLIFNK